MKAEKIIEHLAILSERQIDFERKQQLADQQDAALTHLQTILSAWEREASWAEGNKLTLAELRLLKARLEDQERAWEVGAAVEANPQQVERLQQTAQNNRDKLANLAANACLVDQLVALYGRLTAVQEIHGALQRVADAESNWELLLAKEPQLIVAYECLQALQAELTAQEEKRREIVKLVSALNTAVANDQQQEWLELAFSNLSSLSQKIGRQLAQVENELTALQQQEQVLAQAAAAQDAALQPDRDSVRELEAEATTLRQSLVNEEQALYAWGQATSRFRLPEIDGTSAPDLEALLQEVEAELKHLHWFETELIRA
jgi:hypothetical protein